MALLTDAEIEKIKVESDLAAVVRARGVELRPKGGDLVGLCPFHDDKSPSLHVTPAKRLWRCVSCSATGNVIQFVQRFDGVSFRHAADVLAGGAAFKAPPTCGPVKKSTVPKLANPLAGVSGSVPTTSTTAGRAAAASDPDAFAAEHAADQEALRRVVDYYAERLAANPSALAYLEKRGLADPELLKAFHIGFCDRSLGLRIPNKQRIEGAALRGRLERLGVYNAATGHEFFRGRIVVPVVGDDGAIGTLYGRAVGKVEKADRHRFLPGPQAGVFNPAALSPEALNESGGALILTEGITDALTWWAHGFRHVTTCFSARKPSPEVITAIVAAKVRTVFLAFDPDGAGDDGTADAAALLLARGVEVRRVRFPHGHDANSYALAVKPPRQALAVLLNAAEWLGKGRGVGFAAPVAPALSSLAAKAAKAADAPATPSAGEPAPSVAAPTVAARKETVPPLVPSSGSPTPTPSPASTIPPTATDAGATTPRNATPPASPGAGLRPAGGLWFLDLAEPAREYRLCGLEKLAGFEVLKLTVRLRVGERFHLDALDLARDGERRRYIERAAQETALHPDLLKRDLGKLLLAVEAWLAERAAIDAAAKAKTSTATAAPVMDDVLKAKALEFLRDPKLLDRILFDFDACGVVGEEINKLVGYLAAVSRLMDTPLAVIVQSSSAAGKTTLMDSILSFVPPELRIKYSAMTGQSLFYMGGANLKNRILAIVEEEGAEKASYALKLLQSERELRIASTGKDPHTGRMETQEYHVEGPTMIFLTTTSHSLDEELQNRCLILAVDESREQTERIHALQREARTEAGLMRKARRKELIELHHAAQRLLAPLPVFNPYASRLRFLSNQLRTRRDHEKYLLLIDTITLLFQHQRARKTIEGRGECIITTLDDIAVANRLAHHVLGRGLDEMPPQTRRLLGQIHRLTEERAKASGLARESVRFRARDLRDFTGWAHTQLHIHLARLVDLEYVLFHRADHGQGIVYELLYDGDAEARGGARLLAGLIDVEKLRAEEADGAAEEGAA